MTNKNEEVIKIIKNECYIFDLLDFDRTKMINSALDKAIEALNRKSYKSEARRWKRKYLDLKQQVKPKGKWVNNIHDIPICDQCGYMTPYDRAIDDYEYGNYCPNCGADMREVISDDK